MLGQEALQVRIGAVERHADRDRLAVPQPVVGHLLELVGGPVAEVERPRRAELERIAAVGDVREMERGRAADQPLHRRGVTGHELRRVAPRSP